MKDLQADAHYDAVGRSHNIVGSESSKTIFIVGLREQDTKECNGRLYPTAKNAIYLIKILY